MRMPHSTFQVGWPLCYSRNIELCEPATWESSTSEVLDESSRAVSKVSIHHSHHCGFLAGKPTCGLWTVDWWHRGGLGTLQGCAARAVTGVVGVCFWDACDFDHEAHPVWEYGNINGRAWLLWSYAALYRWS